MGKIKFKAKLNSDLENLDISGIAIYNRNKITYKENEINVTILIFDNKIEMTRSCNEYKINLIFKKNKKTFSTYQVFGSNKIFELQTDTKKLNMDKNKIEITYILEENKFSYVLEMEDL